MRVFAVPGRYRAVLAAAVNDAIEQIRLDEYRRAEGLAPLIPDFMISEQPDPAAIVAIDSVVVLADQTEPIDKAIHRAREVAREERRLRGKRSA